MPLMLASCAPGVDVFQVEPSPRAPRDPAQVQVLLDEPREPFQSIALVEAAGGTFGDLGKWTRRLREEAARLGADAILVMGRAGKNGLIGRAIVFARTP
jgi:hypothetical protein